MVQFRPTIETTIFITHECATYLGVMYDKPCLNLTFVLAEWISMSMWMEIWYNISTHVHCAMYILLLFQSEIEGKKWMKKCLLYIFWQILIRHCYAENDALIWRHEREMKVISHEWRSVENTKTAQQTEFVLVLPKTCLTTHHSSKQTRIADQLCQVMLVVL